MKFRFPVIIIDEDWRSESASGLGIRALAKALEDQGMEVVGGFTYFDVTMVANQAARASAFVVSIDDEEINEDGAESQAVHELRKFIRETRNRNADIPIFLFGETRTSQHIPNDVLKELHGFIHMFEDTPEFVARYIIRESTNYLNSLAPPFFKALVHYANDGSYSWHCPGHSGGVAFMKSPVGQMFHQFFGENMLRADVCNAVEELGQLLDHTGPVAASERNAARIFHADHLYFVTNGTSTSNKVVWHSSVATDDVVLVDRNCHKSVLHAIMMTGTVPIFLQPTRNHLGIIGPIPLEEFSRESIQRKIDQNPLIRDKTRHPRVMTITQSTYDGIVYNVETLKTRLDGYIPNLHFDEAWLPHAAFHPLYHEMHAIGPGRQRAMDSMVFSTQSTHKLLAGLSQASQILVQEPLKGGFDTYRFNESYLMHTSTSPQYAIIASCDVAAAMMEPPGGHALVKESILEALDFRMAMRKVGAEYGDSWWFRVWGPKNIERNGGDGRREDWVLKSSDRWHGFGKLHTGFNMLDPIKATIVTPGLDIDGLFSREGIPAAIVTKYLAEHGVVVEKTGLYSFFVMFTIGITKGRWNTLVTELQQFKTDYDNNQPLWRVMPEFTHAHPQYERIGLKDLSTQIHDAYRQHDVARVTTEMYLSEMQPAMKPSDAFECLAHGKVERVSIDELIGRVTTLLLTPYPPGIPLLIPGERFNRTIVEYLKFVRSFNERFPGFGTDVHGLVIEQGEDGAQRYYIDCVAFDGPHDAVLDVERDAGVVSVPVLEKRLLPKFESEPQMQPEPDMASGPVRPSSSGREPARKARATTVDEPAKKPTREPAKKPTKEPAKKPASTQDAANERRSAQKQAAAKRQAPKRQAPKRQAPERQAAAIENSAGIRRETARKQRATKASPGRTARKETRKG